MVIHVGQESNFLDINDVNLDLFDSDGPDMPAFAVTNDTPSPHTYIMYQFDTDSPQSPPSSSLAGGEIKSEDE